MPFYEPGETHPYDGEEANVKVYASNSLTQSQCEIVSLLYSESRDADLAYKQGKTKTQYLSLFGRIERFIHDRSVFATLPREEWTQPLYIVKALHHPGSVVASDTGVILNIEPLDVMPRWPERNENGQLVRPQGNASFSLAVDMSIDCWYWVRNLLSDGLQYQSLCSVRVHKEIDTAIHQAHAKVQSAQEVLPTDSFAGYEEDLSLSLDLLYNLSQRQVSTRP